MSANLEAVVELMAQNEEAISRLYAACAARFGEHQDFWAGLAAEEKGHAARLRELGKKVQEGRLTFKPDRFRETAIRNFTRHIEDETAGVAKDGFQLINALSIAYFIEDALIERKFFEIFETDSAELKTLLTFLDADTRKHAQKIKTMRERYAPQ